MADTLVDRASCADEVSASCLAVDDKTSQSTLPLDATASVGCWTTEQLIGCDDDDDDISNNDDGGNAVKTEDITDLVDANDILADFPTKEHKVAACSIRRTKRGRNVSKLKCRVLAPKQRKQRGNTKLERRDRSQQNNVRKQNSPKSLVLGRYHCSSCEYETNSSHNMFVHTLDHKLENNTCYYCDACLDSLDLLEAHLLLCHSDADNAKLPYTCHQCSLQFRSHALLMSHVQRHSDDRPYICAICGASFKWRGTLRNHGLIHAGKQHLCDVCGYSTSRKTDLRVHRLMHTGGAFRCLWTGCDFVTTKNYDLKCHVMTHTQGKPYLQCEVCGQSFAWPKNLKQHILTHSVTAVRHRCEHCDYSTVRYHKLKEHLYNKHKIGSAPVHRIRSIDQAKKAASEALQCAVCGRNFATKWDLKRHMLGHASTAEKLKCQHCDYSTLRYDKLKEHLLKKHEIISARRLRHRAADVDVLKLNRLNASEPLPNGTAATDS